MLTNKFFNDMDSLDQSWVLPEMNDSRYQKLGRLNRVRPCSRRAAAGDGRFAAVGASSKAAKAVKRRCMAAVIAGTALTLVTAGFLVLTGCTKPAQDDDYLIRVGSSMITVAEFNREVEAAAEEVFPGESEVTPEAQNDLRMRVLHQLTEELIICERGKELGLVVTDEELNHAVGDIKADYPDDTFEKTLIENAISFQAWKKKLATRILVNKVIESELVDKVQMTSQDVAAYLQTHYPGGVPEGENADEINQKIVRHLRHQKAEEMYPDWIEKLRKAYPVDIQQKRWNHLVSQKSR
jgi:hypothetical protein